MTLLYAKQTAKLVARVLQILQKQAHIDFQKSCCYLLWADSKWLRDLKTTWTSNWLWVLECTSPHNGVPQCGAVCNCIYNTRIEENHMILLISFSIFSFYWFFLYWWYAKNQNCMTITYCFEDMKIASYDSALQFIIRISQDPSYKVSVI